MSQCAWWMIEASWFQRFPTHAPGDKKMLLWNKARRTPRQGSIDPFRVANEAYISNELLVVSWVVKQHAQQPEITVLCRDMLGHTRPNQSCLKTLIRHGSPKNSKQTFCYWCRNINVIKWIKRVGWKFWWRQCMFWCVVNVVVFIPEDGPGSSRPACSSCSTGPQTSKPVFLWTHQPDIHWTERVNSIKATSKRIFPICSQDKSGKIRRGLGGVNLVQTYVLSGRLLWEWPCVRHRNTSRPH